MKFLESKEALEAAMYILVEELNIDSITIPVYTDSEESERVGYGMYCTVVPGIGNVIIMEQYFSSKLTAIELKAIILHEVGHIVLGHLPTRYAEAQALGIDAVNALEIEADEYASKVVGCNVMATTLHKLIGMFSKTTTPICELTYELAVAPRIVALVGAVCNLTYASLN